MSNVTSINCNAGHRYFVRVRVPQGDTPVEPTAAGSVTDIRLRISATVDGAAVNAQLDNLPAVEYASDPALFYYDISQALHQTYLLPLGKGKKYRAIWSKVGTGDFWVDTFVVALQTDV